MPTTKPATKPETCPTCGYSTLGLPTATCPECGNTVPDFMPPPQPWRLDLAAPIVIAGTVIAALMTYFPGTPEWWAPMPLTVIIPWFITENAALGLLPMIAIAALFALPIVRERKSIPVWSSLCVLVLILLSLFWRLAGIPFGERYQTSSYVMVCGIIQMLFIAAIITVWFFNLAHRRFSTVFIWHTLVVLWLASYAFPYYGELP